jgi:phosphohistidine phosphatase SixA
MQRAAMWVISFAGLLLASRGEAQTPNWQSALAAARAGGVVIVCRHGITDSSDENEETLSYADPATQRRLSAAGEKQAESMAKAFRVLGIRAEEVIASPMQRARRSAELMFERVVLDSSWHTRGTNYSGWKRERRLTLLSTTPAHGNRIIFSHIGTIYNVIPRIQGQLEEGDCAVLQPTTSSFDVVGVIPWRAWIAAAADPR